MKVKNVFFKLLVSLLIVITLSNFIFLNGNYSYASSEGEERRNNLIDKFLSNPINILVGGVRIILVAICAAIRSVNSLLASSEGTTGGSSSLEISPFDIFFNRCVLLDANVFSMKDRDGNALNPDSSVYKIRANLAVWYYAIRAVAIGVIAIMLLLNIIRALSKNNSAEQKSAAKSSLTDWVLSFALVMFMHIIVIIVLNFNDLILQAIESFTPSTNSGDFYDELEGTIFSANLILSIATVVVYALLNLQTLKYILIYIQRFLTVVVLVMISPIIPIAYAANKMKGGNGGALNRWLKELCFNVFIQLLHALIYSALISVAMANLTSSSSLIVGVSDLGNALVAIAAMLFIKYAEKMVKAIFGFDTSTVLNTNVFKDAATTVWNAGASVANVTRGGMVPMMGQNGMAGAGAAAGIGGSGLGFGQNLAGATPGVSGVLGNGAQSIGGALGNGIRQATSVAMNGIAGQGTFIGGVAQAINEEANDANSPLALGSGEESSASTDANAEASAYAEAEATAYNGENGSNGADGEAAVVVVGADVQSMDKDKEHDDRLDSISAAVATVNANMQAEEEARAKAATQESEKHTEEHTETETITNESTHTTEKIEGEPVADAEEAPESQEAPTEVPVGSMDEDMLKEQLEQLIGEKVNPALLEKLEELMENDIKPEVLSWTLEAVAGDNPQNAEILKIQLNNQLNELEKKIGTNSAENIMNQIDGSMNDKVKREAYIRSLPENSDERKFAQTYTAASALNDDNMSNKDKIETVIMSGAIDPKDIKLKSNGEQTGAEGRPTESGTTNKEDTPSAVGVATAGNARVMQVVNEANATGASVVDTTASSTDEFEMQPDPAIEDIEDEHLREMMVDLSEIDPVRYRVNGRLEGEVKTEIQEEFNATIQEFTEKMGREPEGIKDIYDNMDAAARKQFAEYKTGKLQAKDLKGDARALATLEIQARNLRFDMEVGDSSTVQKQGTQFEYSIDNQTRKTSSDVNNIIVDLQAERQKRDERGRRKLA